MTIEEFEIEVRNIFIAKGWDSDEDNWFNIGIVSRYKDKTVMVSSLNGEVFATCNAEKYDDVFDKCLKELNSK